MPHDGAGDPPVTASGFQYDETFPADFRWVRRHIENTIDGLRARNVDEDVLSSLEIVLAEALNNVVEHGYPEDARGNIRLILRGRNASIMVEIRDQGKPMPKGRAPMGNHPMAEFNPNDTMPEGGYGWYLIRELVSDLVYDRKNDENMLLFRMSLATETPG